MKPQLPTPQDTVQPAIDKLVELRPRTERHVYGGRYADIFEGWKAQARLNRDRLAAEVVAARLPLAAGEELRDLARSEYWVDLDETPGYAVGDIVMLRQLTNTSSANNGNFPRGVIPAGTKFRKPANQAATPPIAEASYQTTTPVVVDDTEQFPPADLGGGNWQHSQSVSLRIVATETGDGPNLPFFINETSPLAEISTPLFDSRFVVESFLAGGGFTTLSDPTIRTLARANYLGQFGPTEGALIASALKHQGVQRVVAVDDTVNAITVLFLADGSWGCSGALLASAQQIVKDEACGFGCRVAAGFVANVRITVSATVVVADSKSLSDTTALSNAVQSKLRAYFDERPDWYTFRLNSIGGVISTAHPKIIACTSVEVSGNLGVLSEPPARLSASSSFAKHFYLVDDAVKLTFQAPG